MRCITCIVAVAFVAGALGAAPEPSKSVQPHAANSTHVPSNTTHVPAHSTHSPAHSSHAPVPVHSTTHAPQPTPKPTPPPPPPPPPALVPFKLIVNNTAGNETCIILEFTKLDMTFNGTKAHTVDSNTATVDGVMGDCGEIKNSTISAALTATFAYKNSSATVSLIIDFAGQVNTSNVSLRAGASEVLSWYVDGVMITLTNGTDISTSIFQYPDSKSSPLHDSKGTGVNCTSDNVAAPKESNHSSYTFGGLVLQPFNVKNNTLSPTDACPAAAADTKDHTLAIAIAAAVGGLVVIAGLVYLCRRGGRSQYEEIGKA